MKLRTVKGVVRHSDVPNAMNSIDLKEAWIGFITGKTMLVIDESKGFKILNNEGVYPTDLKTFCANHEIDLTITGESWDDWFNSCERVADNFMIEHDQ